MDGGAHHDQLEDYQPNNVHPDLAAWAEKWQAGLTYQDNIVAELLRLQLGLKDEIRQKEAALKAQAEAKNEQRARTAALAAAQADADARRAVEEEDAALSKELAELDRKLNEAEEELMRERHETQAAAARQEEMTDKQQYLDARLAELDKQLEDIAKYGPSAGIKAWGKGPAHALVLINGNFAPFTDKLIVRGLDGGKKASKLLRELVAEDMANEDPLFSNPDILIWLCHSQKGVANTLISSDVISAPSTFHQFIEGFGVRSTANYVCETEHNRPETHIAALLKTHGFATAVQRIYLVGAHPRELMKEVATMQDNYNGLQQAMDQGVYPKVVLVNHLNDAEFGKNVGGGGPTVELGNLFDSSITRNLDGTARKKRTDSQAASSAGKALPPPSSSSKGGSGEVQKSISSSDLGNGDWQLVGGSSSTRKAITAGSVQVPQFIPWANIPATINTDKGTAKKEQAASKGKGKEKERVEEQKVEQPVAGRKINPRKGLLQQDPKICFFQYLSKHRCTNQDCERAHDYAMSNGQIERLREDVGRTACPNLRKYNKCKSVNPDGEFCFFSHDPKVIAKSVGM